MNKKQLVAKISSTLGQSKADAERTFDSITTIILDALKNDDTVKICLLYTSPSPRDVEESRMPSSA